MSIVLVSLFAADFDQDSLPDSWAAQYGFSTNGYTPLELVGWWQMDDASKANIADRSGSSVTGSLNNFVPGPFIPGLFSNALYFSSNSFSTFSTNHPKLTLTNDFTFSAWYFAPSTTRRADIATWRDINGNNWLLGVQTNGVPRLLFNGVQKVETASTSAVYKVNDSAWHHIVGVYARSNSSATVYLDGFASAKSIITNWNPSRVSSFTFGSTNNTIFALDEARLYRTAISSNGIEQLPATYYDPDNDGLSNLQEYQMGTDPLNPDTDGDGILDGFDSTPTGQGMMLVGINSVLSPDEFDTDTNTVALYHFDGDYTDSSGNALDLTATPGVQLFAGNLGWMQTPAGQVMRLTGLNQQVTTTIPDNLFLTSSNTQFTIEARFFPRTYKAYSISNAPIIRMYQNWDAQVMLEDQMWPPMAGDPAGPVVKVGNPILVTASNWMARVSTNAWHAFRFTYDGSNAACYVDTNLLAQGSTTINTAPTWDWSFSMGNFDGDIDEVRISRGIRSGASNPDTDGDGLPDAWEIQYFGNLSQTSSGDYDGDGVSNLLEYQRGTSPADFYNGVTPSLAIFSGNNQSAQTNSFLPLPLIITVSTNGVALTNAPVTFTMFQGGAKLALTNGGAQSTSLSLRTATNGRASAVLWLGTVLETNLVDAIAITGSSTTSVQFTERTVDNVPPGIVISSPTNGQTTTNLNFNVTGLVGDTYQVGWMTLWVTNSVVTNQVYFNWTTNTPLVNFNVTLTNLAVGTNSIRVRASDLSGNTNNLAVSLIRTAGVPPVLNVILPLDGQSVAGTVTPVSGIISDEQGIDQLQVLLNSSLVTTLRGGDVTNRYFTVWANGLKPGTNTIDVIAMDRSGLSSSQHLTVIQDQQAANVPVNDLAVWLRADQGVVQDSNGGVSTWTDQSGSTNHAAQALGTLRPVWVDNTLNGKPVVRFDGVDDFLTFGPNTLSQVSDVSWFMVSKIRGTALSQALLSRSQGGGGVNKWIWWLVGDIIRLHMQPGSADLQSDAMGTQSHAWGVYEFFKNGSVYMHYRNARSAGSWSVTTGFAPGNSGFPPVVSDLRLGQAEGNNFLNGDVAEVLLYQRTLSISERQTVESYLMSKYAIIDPSAGFAPGGGSSQNGSLTSSENLSIAQDQDQDGMLDAWELAYGLNPANPLDALQDGDGDGISNRDEYLRRSEGLNPLDYFNGLMPWLQTVGPADQRGLASAVLSTPFIVQAIDSMGVALTNAPIRFAVASGDGTISTNTGGIWSSTYDLRTDVAGRAQIFAKTGVVSPFIVRASVNTAGSTNTLDLKTTIVTDALAPSVTFTTIEDFQQTTNASVVAGGKVTDDKSLNTLRVLLNATQLTNHVWGGVTSGTFTVTANGLTLGTNAIQGIVTDTFGNAATNTIRVVRLDSESIPIPQTDLRLWLRSDKGVSYNSANEVTAWADATTNLNNAVQTISSDQSPQFIPNALNGNPVVRFDGLNDFLSAGTNASLNVGDFTFVTVTAFKSTTGARALLSRSEGGGPVNKWIYWYIGAMDLHAQPGNSHSASPNFTPVLNKASVFELTKSGSLYTHMMDGTNLGAAVSGPAALPTVASDFRVGQAEGANWFSGDIAEVLVYGHALNATERQSVENYLQLKYGISGAVALTVPAGTYNGPLSVGLSTAMPSATIRYTLNGTDPTPTSTAYTGTPLVFSSTATLKARVVFGTVLGPVTSATYLIRGSNGDATLPTITVTAPVNNLTVTNTAVTVTGSASDNWAIDSVRFLLNAGAVTNLPAATTNTTSMPFSLSIPNLPVGTNTLTSMVIDRAGNTNSLNRTVIRSTGGSSAVSQSGLVLWLQADTGLEKDGASGMITWADQSASSNAVSQSDASLRPVWKDNVINGKPVVRFDGVNDFMTAGMAPSLTFSDYSIFSVASLNGSANAQSLGTQAIFSRDEGAPLSKWIWWRTGNSMEVHVQGGNAHATSNPLNLVAGKAMLLGLVKGGATHTHYRNAQANGTSAWGGAIPSINSDFRIGQAENNYFLNGDLAEVLIYTRALSDVERQSIESYLMAKYGLVDAPTMTPGGGSYASTTAVQLSTLVPNSTIRYTLDGSDPTTSSLAYTSAISLSATTTLKACAYVGTTASSISSATYYINDTDQDGLRDDWETSYYGNLDQTAEGDSDGDGFSNLDEYRRGTSPLDFYNGTTATLTKMSGDFQGGITNAFLAQPLIVKATGTSSVAWVNAPVTFKVTSGGATLTPIQDEYPPATNYATFTDGAGLAKIFVFQPPPFASTNKFEASVVTGSTTNKVTFTTFAGSPFKPQILFTSPTNGMTFVTNSVLTTGSVTGSFPLVSAQLLLNQKPLQSFIPASTNRWNFSTNAWPVLLGSNDLQVVAWDAAGVSNSARMTVWGSFTDTDSDGMPDTWETARGLNPNVAATPTEDTDGDGLPDIQEYRQNRDPKDYFENTTPQLAILGPVQQEVFVNQVFTQAFKVWTGTNGLKLTNAPLTWLMISNTAGGISATSSGAFTASTLLRTDTNGESAAFVKMTQPGAFPMTVSAATATTTNTVTFNLIATDPLAPLLNLTSPTDGQVISTNVITYSGTWSDNHGLSNAVVFMNGVVATNQIFNGSTNMAFTMPITVNVQRGTNAMVITGWDLSGNATQRTVSFVRTFVDSDADGMADDWETQQFGNLSQTALGDFDGDGVLNNVDAAPTNSTVGRIKIEITDPLNGTTVSP